MRYGNYQQRVARRKELADMRASGKMKTRDQQRGECQVCGRDVAVDVVGALDVKTSKHGYTVEPGWGFTGTCYGADELPYELSCNILKAHVVVAKNQLNQMRNTIKQYRASEVGTIYETVIDYNKPRKSRESRVARTPADFPRDKQHSYKGKYLYTQTWEQFSNNAADDLARSADGLARHIKEQQARIDAWVYAPEKIRTVKVEVK